MDRHLHIVSFDVPYPVNYGGVVDVYYKIKALHNEGVRIHLHCFEYGRGQQDHLSELCEQVHYYSRNTSMAAHLGAIPYIVRSRQNEALVNNLLSDEHPIILEGVHCSSIVLDERFSKRKILLRLFNVEYLYYKHLSLSTGSFWKKLFFQRESRKLFEYEKQLANKVFILSLSEQDAAIYRSKFQSRNIATLPAFIPYEEVKSAEGIGDFCLYHGNLSVAENEKVARWLITEVFKNIPVKFVIAGNNPSRALKDLANTRKKTMLISNPTEEKMQSLIRDAQVNILPSLNVTGVKLKLLNALYNGRHCVVNPAGVIGTSLDAACHIGNTADDISSIITQLFHQPFTGEDLRLRKFLLHDKYNNRVNVQRLSQWIW